MFNAPLGTYEEEKTGVIKPIKCAYVIYGWYLTGLASTHLTFVSNWKVQS